MKNQKQLVAKGSRRTRQLEDTRVMRRMRPTTPTHLLAERVSLSKFEVEAEQAAERILRGEHNVARMLTSIPAASVFLPASVGHKITAPLLADLEQGFGANLSEVRIHSDYSAAEAVSARDAQAFTVGRNIYFARGMYQPGNDAGKRLIAHEVAHVLQQTGRQSQGEVRATDLSSVGVPQFSRKSPIATSEKVPDFDTIVARHLAEAGDNNALKKAIASIENDRRKKIGEGKEDEFWSKLEDAAVADTSTDDATRAIRSFRYDLLKFKQLWLSAAKVLASDHWLWTTFFSSDVYENLSDDQGYAWIMAQWNATKFFEPYRSIRFLDAVLVYLIGPTRDIPNLGLQTDFNKDAREFLEKTKHPTEVIPNELFCISVWAVNEFDELRINSFREFAQHAAGNTPASQLTPQQRGQVALELSRWASDPDLISAKRAPEVGQLVKTFAESIKTLADAVVGFWAQITGLQEIFESDNENDPANAKAREQLRQAASRPEFTKFASRLHSAANDLFKLDADGNPQSPVDYEVARDKLLTVLTMDTRSAFEAPLLRFIQSTTPKSKDEIVRAQVLGYVLRRAFALSVVVRNYSRVQDEKYGGELTYASGKPAADLRIVHRMDVAAPLWLWSKAMGWDDTKTLAEQVIRVNQVGAQSMLALLDDWVEDPNVEVGRMAYDVNPSERLRGAGPLTVGDFVSFFQSVYMKAYAAKLDTLLASTAPYDLTQPAMIVQAQKVAESEPSPKRYYISEARANLKAEDKDKFADLVRSHPKTARLLQKLNYPPDIAPIKPGPIFLWTLPDYSKLVAKLKQQDGFSLVIYVVEAREQKIKPDEDPDLSEIKGRADDRWLADLARAMQSATKEEKASVDAAAADFRSKLSSEESIQRTRLIALMKRASIIDRTQRITGKVHNLLASYDRNKQLQQTKAPVTNRSLLVYEIPYQVADEIKKIVLQTGPVEDQPLHEAAAVLELADLLDDKLGKRPRQDVAFNYIPLLKNTKETATAQPQPLQDVLLDSEKGPGWLTTRLGSVDALLDKLKTVEAEEQKKFGLFGIQDRGGRSILAGVGHGYQVSSSDKEFTIGDPNSGDAITWRLVKVHQDFIFYPKYSGTEAELWQTDANGDPIATLSKGTALVDLEINHRTRTLTGDDEALLTKLSFAVTMEAILRQLEDLAKYIETFGEITLDVLELIPGEGQLLMAARLAAGIFQFILSPEFDVLKDDLLKNPRKYIDEGIDLLKAMVQPQMLWDFLLFFKNPFSTLHSGTVEPPKPKLAGKSSIIDKIKRLLLRLYNFGKSLIGSAGRLQSFVRWKAEQLEYLVLTRPILNFVLRWIANHFDEIMMVADEVSDLVRSSGEGDAKLSPGEKIEKAFESWPEYVVNTVNELNRFELPKEIVPMWEIIGIIVDLVVSRLNAKYRFAAQAILKLLDLIGQKEPLYKLIAEQLSDYDPNEIWRVEIEERVNPNLKIAQRELSSTVFDKLSDVPFFSEKTKSTFKKAKQDAEDADIQVQRVDTPPETHAFGLKPWSRPVNAPLPRGEGTPLPLPVRASAESRFGHDFSHVRLHAGASAARFTAAAGARALTTGSHVYMRDEPPSATTGRSTILDHELAHVLQQAGPRPRGERHDSRPVSGRLGRGIVYNPGKEAAAERAANQFHAPAHEPARISSTGTEGFQPALSDVMRRLLDELTGTTEIEKAAEEKRPVVPEKLPENIRDQVSGLWESFEKLLQERTNAKIEFSAPLNTTTDGEDIAKRICEYLLGNLPPSEESPFSLKNEIYRESADAQEEDKSASKDEKKQGQPVVKYKLNVGRLETALARDIFGKTGVASSITLSRPKEANEKVQVENVRVRYLHLPELHGNSKFWAIATKNLFKDDDQRKKWLPRVKAYLEQKSVSVGIWEKSEFRLQAHILQDTISAYGAEKTDRLEAKDLPPKLEYLSAKAFGTGPQVGLRLGHYSDDTQKGPERESHHITQYLLVEFFHNAGTVPAFPLLNKFSKRDVYPGVEREGDKAKQEVGKTTIPLEEWNKGRGGKMPAILLARDTHRTGNLHITAKADDLQPSPVDSPAEVIRSVFQRNITALDSEYVAKEKAAIAQNDLSLFEGYKKTQKQPPVKDTIYTAVQETYHWMRDKMQPRLKDALMGIEAKYYNDRAEQKPIDDRIHREEMTVVWAEAVSHNEKEMAKGGWV
jgi:hypothetical protein